MLTDYWTHTYHDQPNDHIENDDFDEDLAEAIAAIPDDSLQDLEDISHGDSGN